MPRLPQYGPGNAAGKREFLRQRKAAKRAAVPRAGSVLKQVIKKVIKGSAETKQKMFYQSTSGAGNTNRATGTYNDRGWALQDGSISTKVAPNVNNTDLLQLIPEVEQGASDNQRIGDQITPTSLVVHGRVRVALATELNTFTPTDIKVVIYVLQHVSLKDYTNLYAQNQFSQLLENGENTTVLFNGQSWQSRLPVAKQYYRLLKKKIITLRYAGAVSNTGNPPTNVSVANSHNWFAEYSMSLGKHLPAKLKYPENNVAAPTLNEPTNSSIFMCMGYYNQSEPASGGTFLSNTLLEQTYVSTLSWKDL